MRYDNVHHDHAEQEFLRRQFRGNRRYIVMGWVALLISGLIMVWAAVQCFEWITN